MHGSTKGARAPRFIVSTALALLCVGVAVAIALLFCSRRDGRRIEEVNRQTPGLPPGTLNADDPRLYLPPPPYKPGNEGDE